MNYAIIIGGLVDNIVVWDGVTEWAAPPNSVLVKLNDGEWCDIRCLYDANADPRFYPSPVEA